RVGGGWNERVPNNGAVRHLTVVFVSPGKELRLTGGLGPLQELGVAAILIFKLTGSRSETKLEMRYSVGGYRPGGLRSLAAPVDSVLKSQLLRLKNLIEKGRPQSP